MLGILNIINKYFWKSWTGPFFAFVVSPLIVIISMSLFNMPTIILPASLSVPIICIGAIVVPQTVFEFKQSIILKRIGVTDIKPGVFMLALIIYFISFMILSTALNLAIVMAFFYGVYGNDNVAGQINFYNTFASPDYLSWIYVELLTMALALSIGLFSASAFKSVLAIQTCGLLMIIVSLMLGGALVPFSLLSESPILRNVSYIVPFTYTSSMTIEAWFGNMNEVFENSTYTFERLNVSVGPMNAFQVWTQLATKNYVLGYYDTLGNFVNYSTQEISQGLLNGGQGLSVVHIDANRGLLFQTTLDKLSATGTANLTVNPTNSIFNFDNSNIWDMNSTFFQVSNSMGLSHSQGMPKMQLLWTGVVKVVNQVMPYVFMIVCYLCATLNFTWSNRGA